MKQGKYLGSKFKLDMIQILKRSVGFDKQNLSETSDNLIKAQSAEYGTFFHDSWRQISAKF